MKKKWLLFALIFLFLVPGSRAQIKINTYTTATDTFYWKRYEKIPAPEKFKLRRVALPGQDKVIRQFMNSHETDYPQFTNDTIRLFPRKEWQKSIFPVDINHDGFTDIIYSGSGGGESDITRVYLNRGENFELIFEDFQYLTDFIITDKKLTSIKTADIGCCADYLTFTRAYAVRWNEGNPEIVKGKQTVWFQHTELPNRFYHEPVPFTAAGDTLTLRASAARLDEPYNPVWDSFGNIIAKYRGKCRGKILAKKLTGKINDWYFVEVNPDVSPSASVLYNTDKLPTFIRGWVSGHSIKPE